MRDSVYRAPESTKAAVEERTKDDRDYVLELMNDVLEVDCRIEDIKRMFRMGLRGEHVRPLQGVCRATLSCT